MKILTIFINLAMLKLLFLIIRKIKHSDIVVDLLKEILGKLSKKLN